MDKFITINPLSKPKEVYNIMNDDILIPMCADVLAEKKRKLGNDKYKARHYDEALKLYTEAITLCPNSAEYLSNRSACYIMLSNYVNALEDARNAIAFDPTCEKANFRIVKCCLMLGDIVGAEQAFSKMQELNINTMSIQAERESLEQLKRLDVIIKKHFDNKAYRNVVYYADNALKIAPNANRYRLMKSECLAYLDRFDEALDIALSIMKTDATAADAIYVRGLCLYFTDNLEKSISHFESTLRVDRDHVKAREMRSKARLLLETRERGKLLFKTGRFREAQAVYTDGLTVDSLNKDINSKFLYNRALVNSKLGLLCETIEDCCDVLKINSQYIKALLLRARAYTSTGKHDEAVKDYESAVKIQKTPEIRKLLRDAKVALKKSKRKDYYKILGVGRQASDDEIKKAYRKQAMVHHPDRHANKTEEEQKQEEKVFKEIGEAYAILSDPHKKQRYDSGQDLDESETEFDPNTLFKHFFSFGNQNTFEFQF